MTAPTSDLTRCQRVVFDTFRRLSADLRRPPSVREVARAAGLSSPATVHAHLARLRRRGLLLHFEGEPKGSYLLAEGFDEVAFFRGRVVELEAELERAEEKAERLEEKVKHLEGKVRQLRRLLPVGP